MSDHVSDHPYAISSVIQLARFLYSLTISHTHIIISTGKSIGYSEFRISHEKLPWLGPGTY